MKTFLRFVLLTLLLSVPSLAATEYQASLSKAKEMAAAEKKLLFVFYGRQACGICKATKAMIKSRDIRLPESKYVLVDLNCDDPAVSAEFHKNYGGQSFGKTLPFVVIADFNGKPLGSTSGYMDGKAWSRVIKDAEKKALTAAPAGGGSSNWPFKSAPTGSR